MQGTSKQIRRAFRYAFPHTIPIFAGFWFLGITYGVYMNVSGFSFVYPMLMSMTIIRKLVPHRGWRVEKGRTFSTRRGSPCS